MIKKIILRSGDLLFYRPKNVFHISAWFISWAQNVIGKTPHKVDYCHVAIVDKDTDYLLESRWPKSRHWKIDWEELDKNYYIELWRIRRVIQEQVDEILQWANEHLGEWYDLGMFVWGWFDKKHEEVCSTFVYKAYHNAGVDFKQIKTIGKGTLITPDELIANTDIIERIQ